MSPNNNALSKEELENLSDRERMSYKLGKPSVDEPQSSKALTKLKMKIASDTAQAAYRTPGNEPPPDSATFPFILEGQLASPEEIQMIGRLSEVPKIEETVTIPVDGQEMRTVQFCRVPKSGFLKILNWAEFDTVLILFDGMERYGRVMVEDNDKNEKK